MGDTEQLRARIEAQVAAKRLKAAETGEQTGHRAPPAEPAAPRPAPPVVLPPAPAPPVVAPPPIIGVNGNGTNAHADLVRDSPLPVFGSAADVLVPRSREDEVTHQVRVEWSSAAAQEAELARRGEAEAARREAEQQAEVARLADAVRDAEVALRIEAERRNESERRLAELEQRLAAVETAAAGVIETPGTAPVAEQITPEPVTPEPVAPEPLAPEPVAPEPVAPEPVAPEPVVPPVESVTPPVEPVQQPRQLAELSPATAANWPAPVFPPARQPDARVAEPDPRPAPAVEVAASRWTEQPLGLPRHAVAPPITRRADTEAPQTRRTGRLVLRVVLMVVIAALAAVLLRTFVIASYYIPSASMEPTLHGCSGCNNDHVLVNKLSYHLHAVNRGDVVVFHRPAGAPTDEKVLIKRVIGLPGDVLTDRDDTIYVNGRPLHEPYLNPTCSGTQNFPAAPITVPKGDVFVMGDNRCDSSDSRVFGPITESSIIGRAFVIVWPFGRIHYL